jgi:hypothetical protein
MLGLAVLYRFGPDRDKPQWRWVSPGAGAATILWIVGSGKGGTNARPWPSLIAACGDKRQCQH